MAKAKPKSNSQSRVAARSRKSTLAIRMRKVAKARALAAAANPTTSQQTQASDQGYVSNSQASHTTSCSQVRSDHSIITPQTSSHRLNGGLPSSSTAATATQRAVIDSDESDSESLDESMMVPPLNVGTGGPSSILSVMQKGTPEARDAVLNECNVIFECRACGNLFRSLGNFLAHKRRYCKTHACRRMKVFDDRYFAYPSLEESRVNEWIDQPRNEEHHNVAPVALSETASAPVVTKTVSGAAKRKSKPVQAMTISVTESDEVASDKKTRLNVLMSKLASDRNLNVRNPSVNDGVAINLSLIATTSKAVRIETSHRPDVPVWADEEQNELSKTRSQADGASRTRSRNTSPDTAATSNNNIDAPSPSSSQGKSPPKELDSDSGSDEGVVWKCPDCGCITPSNKLLRDHLITYHTTSADILYPCVDCHKQFNRLYNAIRHMQNSHRDVNIATRSEEWVSLKSAILEQSILSPSLVKKLRQTADQAASFDGDLPKANGTDGRESRSSIESGFTEEDSEFPQRNLRKRNVSADSTDSAKLAANAISSKKKKLLSELSKNGTVDPVASNQLIPITTLVCSVGCGKQFTRTSALCAHEKTCRFSKPPLSPVPERAAVPVPSSLPVQQPQVDKPVPLPPVPMVNGTAGKQSENSASSSPSTSSTSTAPSSSASSAKKIKSQNRQFKVSPVFRRSSRVVSSGSGSGSTKTPEAEADKRQASPKQNGTTSSSGKSAASTSASASSSSSAGDIPYHHKRIDTQKLCMSPATLASIRKIINLIDLKCEECPATIFMNAHQLINHSVTHFGCSVYKCKDCLFQCTTLPFMESHVTHAHNVTGSMLKRNFYVELEKARPDKSTTTTTAPVEKPTPKPAEVAESPQETKVPKVTKHKTIKQILQEKEREKEVAKAKAAAAAEVKEQQPAQDPKICLKISLSRRVSSRAGKASPHWSTSSPGSAPAQSPDEMDVDFAANDNSNSNSNSTNSQSEKSDSKDKMTAIKEEDDSEQDDDSQQSQSQSGDSQAADEDRNIVNGDQDDGREDGEYSDEDQSRGGPSTATSLIPPPPIPSIRIQLKGLLESAASATVSQSSSSAASSPHSSSESSSVGIPLRIKLEKGIKHEPFRLP